jgi:hypothetical protein
MAKKKSATNKPVSDDNKLYMLEVYLFSGPLTEQFVKTNPVVSRTIAIRGDQTLDQLHRTIFKAFDRWDEHMYEFQVGGKRPMDPKARRYTLRGDPIPGPHGPEDRVKTTRIDSLGLKKDQAFGYWFDFGDDWWHQINVLEISPEVPPGRYPRITKRVGQSPPQYPDLDEEDE